MSGNKLNLAALLGVLANFVVGAAALHGATADADPARVTLTKSVHFTGVDGGDAMAAPAVYRVEKASDTALRLVGEGNQPDILIQAQPIQHEGKQYVPLSMVVASGADQIHVVMLAPGGAGLDAVGSYSGMRSRGLSPETLSPTAIRGAALSSPAATLQFLGTLPKPVGPPVNAPPTNSGTYRVTINGFHAGHATQDDPPGPNIDGIGDEIYVAAAVLVATRVYSPDPSQFQVVATGVAQTGTYGSANAQRIEAGSASATGGIRTGDDIPIQFTPWLRNAAPSSYKLPLIVWQGVLSDQNHDMVSISPSIWESDGNAQSFAAWAAYLTQYADLLAPGYPAAYNNLNVLWAAGSNALTYSAGFGMDRPIGATAWVGALHGYIPQHLILTRQKIEALLTSNQTIGGLPRGIIPLQFYDAPSTQLGAGGDYTIYLQVERL
jgi:hypothetical protein